MIAFIIRLLVGNPLSQFMDFKTFTSDINLEFFLVRGLVFLEATWVYLLKRLVSFHSGWGCLLKLLGLVELSYIK